LAVLLRGLSASRGAHNEHVCALRCARARGKGTGLALLGLVLFERLPAAAGAAGIAGFAIGSCDGHTADAGRYSTRHYGQPWLPGGGTRCDGACGDPRQPKSVASAARMTGQRSPSGRRSHSLLKHPVARCARGKASWRRGRWRSPRWR
jgi:hypothetical protein